MGVALSNQFWRRFPFTKTGDIGSFGKAFMELKELGLIDRIPRMAIVNATGAATLTELFNDKNLRWNDGNIDQAVINA